MKSNKPQTVIKHLKAFLKFITFTIPCFIAVYVEANTITKPSFVKSVDKSKLDDAGGEIYAWAIGIVVIVLALAALRPAYLFSQDKKEEAFEHIKNLLMAAGAIVFLGGAIFAIISVAG